MARHTLDMSQSHLPSQQGWGGLQITEACSCSVLMQECSSCVDSGNIGRHQPQESCNEQRWSLLLALEVKVCSCPKYWFTPPDASGSVILFS